ncbi:hypothetical protein [Anaerovibrio lipolyticus]|uniref:hypothetical protein n=1 Tax=Anaerovibrio lipolyticus TaxID=82374 RepID=UPI0018CC3AE9|nr:hypothetical protein [Anaerovibrio lipolyticus]
MAKIGIVDADLLDRGTRFPNLSLMKLAGYKEKVEGYTIELIEDWDKINPDNGQGYEDYEHIYVAKVFDFTQIPINLDKIPNLTKGGTGFFWVEASSPSHRLPDEIEHFMPKYDLYDQFIEHEIARGIKPGKFTDYQEYSIGFTTRGCIRKCPFCVNQNCDHVERWSPVSEFLADLEEYPNRKKIYLWDDNILAFPQWESVLNELIATGRPFSFRQGMDIRLMTEAKAKKICGAKYIGDYTFAFDNYKDKKYILRGLKPWLKYAKKQTRLYILCGFKGQGALDIAETFKRIQILMEYKCIPYIMRHEFYEKSPYKGTYINLARWCNQPNFFKKKSYREYCEANGENSSTMRYARKFEEEHPHIAAAFYDMRFDMGGKTPQK